MGLIRLQKLREHSDHRGSLVENTLPEIMSKSKHFFVSRSKPGVLRGNHYHYRKSEWFCVISGECRFVAEDVKTKKREEITVKSEDNLAINIGPDVSHAFKNTGKGDMVLLALVNEVFDKDDPDTYAYEVIKE